MQRASPRALLQLLAGCLLLTQLTEQRHGVKVALVGPEASKVLTA